MTQTSISRNSWHFKLVRLCYTNIPRTNCGYWFAVVVSAFTGGVIAAGLAFLIGAPLLTLFNHVFELGLKGDSLSPANFIEFLVDAGFILFMIYSIFIAAAIVVGIVIGTVNLIVAFFKMKVGKVVGKPFKFIFQKITIRCKRIEIVE